LATASALWFVSVVDADSKTSIIFKALMSQQCKQMHERSLVDQMQFWVKWQCLIKYTCIYIFFGFGSWVHINVCDSKKQT
jgi:hypothetical protein